MFFKKKYLHFSLLDIVLLAMSAGGLCFVLYKAFTGLNYHWKWEVIPQYLIRYDPSHKVWAAGLLTHGLLTTLRLSIWASLFSLCIGIVVGLFRVSPFLFKRQVATTYVGLIRNTPPLVLIFIFYFFVADQIMTALHMDDFIYSLSQEAKTVMAIFFGPMNRFPQFLAAVLTLTLFEGAYITEIVRAGIESIEPGQWEASTALGMRRWQALVYVILPQGLQRMLPALAGQFISVIKDSAIVSVISIEELTFQAQQIMTTTYRSFEVWTTVMVMYFILTFFCSLAVRKLELTLRRS